MHNRIPQTNAAHNALCSAVCALSDRPAWLTDRHGKVSQWKGQPGSFGRVDYTPHIPTATTTLVTATGMGDRWKGQPGPSIPTITIGRRMRFEGTLTPSIRGDKFRVLKDVSIVYMEGGRMAIYNMHVIQARKKSPWHALRDYDRVAYMATVRDWAVTFDRHVLVSIERPILATRTGFNLP